jgi:hypothetical protein
MVTVSAVREADGCSLPAGWRRLGGGSTPVQIGMLARPSERACRIPATTDHEPLAGERRAHPSLGGADTEQSDNRVTEASEPLEPESSSAEQSVRSDRNGGTFVFEGVEVRASLHSDAKWHVCTKGVEAVNTHLGTATRILFDPKFHGDTRALIREILAEEASRRG